MQFHVQNALTLPCTNAFFTKHRVDWKESCNTIWRHPSFKLCELGSILSQSYATKNRCGVGFGRFSTQNHIEIAWKIACVNGPLMLHIVSSEYLSNVPAVPNWAKFVSKGGRTSGRCLDASWTLWRQLESRTRSSCSTRWTKWWVRIKEALPRDFDLLIQSSSGDGRGE